MEPSKEQINQPLIDKWALPDVLSRQQVNQSMMDIQDIHPLRELAKFDNILPNLSCCRKYKCCQKKPNFKLGLRQTLLKEMSLKMSKSEMAVQENPFLILGYGVNAYFEIIKSLCWMMFIMTLAFMPIMSIYSSNSVNALASRPKAFLNVWTLGNFGASSVVCKRTLIKQGTIDFQCPHGTIIDVSDPIFGIMNIGISEPIYCQESAIWKDPVNIEPENTCTSFINTVEIYERIVQNCQDQKSCVFSTKDWWKKTGVPSWINDQTSSENICNDEAHFYMQMPCLIPKDKKTGRQIFGLYIGSTAVFIYLFAIVYFDYINQVQKNKYVDWDVQTITAGDYSTEHDIDEAAYLRWQKVYLDEQNPISEVAQFKIYLQEILEQRINSIPDQGLDPSDERDYVKKIAQISFAYNNAEVVNWLMQRGADLRQEKWEKCQHIQAHIKKEITKKNSPLLDQLQTPVSAFVTWETEEAVNRAYVYNDSPQCPILGQSIEIQQASEPTDIIWEHRHISPQTRKLRKCAVLLIVGFLLILSGVGMFILEGISFKAEMKFPIKSCSVVQKEFYSPIYHDIHKDKWKRRSLEQYKQQMELYKQGKQQTFNGVMECFCQASFNSQKQNEAFEMTLENGQKYSAKMCLYYNHDTLIATIAGSCVSFFIVAINLILKKIIIKLIYWVGEDTLSQQLSSVANYVFAAQFFNTALLLLLINANMTEHKPYFLTKYLNGNYYDYSVNWYYNVGEVIVQTMTINALLPYITIAIGFGLPWLKKKLDSKFSGDPYNTKKTAMAQYKELYSGADYVIHFKCAGVMNIVWVTMMYGVGLPLLFPLATFNFFNQFICERITVSYMVKLPPALDDQLTNNLISKCKLAPLLLMFNGYWMLSNQESFANKYSFIDTIQDKHMKSQHLVSFDVRKSMWAFPMLVLAVCSVFIYIAKCFFDETLKSLGFGMQRKDIEVDEDLPSFFDAIRLSQADEIIAEEENMQNNYGFLIQDPDTIDELEKVVYPKQSMQGTPWYSILANPKYAFEFNYIGANVTEREKLIEDGKEDEEDDDGNMIPEQVMIRGEQSDFIVVMLNLSCIPDSVVRKIDFMPGWQVRFKQHMNNYKYNWRGTACEKWRYQDQDLEDKYREFINEQEKKDIDLIRETEIHEDCLRDNRLAIQIEMEHKAKENRDVDPYNNKPDMLEESAIGGFDDNDDHFQKHD